MRKSSISSSWASAFKNKLPSARWSASPRDAPRLSGEKRSRFTGEQIIGILREHEAGKKVEEIDRSHKISTFTFYKWKKKFSGRQVIDAKRMREMEPKTPKKVSKNFKQKSSS